MPSVPNETYSFQEMKRKWDSDNPDEPYIRSKTTPSWYGIDTWIVRLDDNGKVISATGWTDEGEYLLVGGTKSIANSQRGHMSDLVKARTRMAPDKPLFAAFTNADSWLRANENAGWNIHKYGIPDEVMSLIPKDALNQMKSAYPDGNWGIKPARTISKGMWFEELKKKKATATHNSRGEKKDRCAKLADEKYGMKSSAYKSGYMVQCRRGKVSRKK